MTLVIISILLIAYLLIATERLSNMNKAAVAVFAGTVGWVLYICYGNDYVMSQHPSDYTDFLNGAKPTSIAVKEYIAQNIFLKYVGHAASIVLFLLATMTIVEILNNNGCFDFLKQLMRTRRSKHLLWIIGLVTFVISANLDNLTTTVMMLTMMHSIIPNRRYRMIYGSAIVIATNCGGSLTLIGDPSQLVIWDRGAVTATSFSMTLLAPCLIAWVLPTWWISRMLPERIETEWSTMPYRGDDTNLNVWQRLLMLVVGIGGLWFIPTFHNITKLSPFLGAMCVLAVLWIVNEIFNRKLMHVDDMIQRRTPRVLQYGILQMMLFVMGMMLAVGVVQETGAVHVLAEWLDRHIHSVWIFGGIAGVISSVLDNFASAISFFSLYSVADASATGYASEFATNGMFWKVIAYSVGVGGSILCFGSISGLAFMKMERLHIGWYFRHIGFMAFISWVIGLIVMWLVSA